jgi:hypothetical protein
MAQFAKRLAQGVKWNWRHDANLCATPASGLKHQEPAEETTSVPEKEDVRILAAGTIATCKRRADPP